MELIFITNLKMEPNDLLSNIIELFRDTNQDSYRLTH